MSTIDDMPSVMGEDGEFHAQDEAVDLSGTPIEAWVALGFFGFWLPRFSTNFLPAMC